jgi:hypothetical protein
MHHRILKGAVYITASIPYLSPTSSSSFTSETDDLLSMMWNYRSSSLGVNDEELVGVIYGIDEAINTAPVGMR